MRAAVDLVGLLGRSPASPADLKARVFGDYALDISEEEAARYLNAARVQRGQSLPVENLEDRNQEEPAPAAGTPQTNTPGETVTVQITSFGYGHPDGAPEAHITLDLRKHFRDPHINPQMRYMTAYDELVRQNVMATAGIRDLVLATVAAIEAYAAGPSAGDITVAVGCAGGRHRAATVAMALAAVLTGDPAADELGLADAAAQHRDRPHEVELLHRDLSKSVITR